MSSNTGVAACLTEVTTVATEITNHEAVYAQLTSPRLIQAKAMRAYHSPQSCIQ